MASILLISPEPWAAHAVSKHHYARLLAALGHLVLFVEPPDPSLSHLELHPIEDQPCLLLVRGPRVAPGLRFVPGPLRRWLERRWLNQLEERLGHRIEVIWLFENSRFYDLRFAGDRLRIYHQVDLNQTFHPFEAARSADICFCTTELIRQRLLPHNPRVMRLHHGLAPCYETLELDASQQQRLDGPGVHAAYIGNLDMAYLDQELLIRLIQAHPTVHFHLIGGYRPDSRLRQELFACPQVHWWGQVPSSLIPRILDCMDLQLVCYQASHHADQASPHKFLEYLASGRTIVATYTAEYAAHAHLLAMSEPGSNDGYLPLFASVLADLPHWNSPQRQAARQAFAADHTYSRQLQRIDGQLLAHGLSPLQLSV